MRGELAGAAVRGLPPQSRRPGTPGPYRVVSPSRAVVVRSALIRPCGATSPSGEGWGYSAWLPPRRLTRRFAGYTRRCGRPRRGPPGKVQARAQLAGHRLGVYLADIDAAGGDDGVLFIAQRADRHLPVLAQVNERLLLLPRDLRGLRGGVDAPFRRRRGASSWAAALPAPLRTVAALLRKVAGQAVIERFFIQRGL